MISDNCIIGENVRGEWFLDRLPGIDPRVVVSGAQSPRAALPFLIRGLPQHLIPAPRFWSAARDSSRCSTEELGHSR